MIAAVLLVVITFGLTILAEISGTKLEMKRRHEQGLRRNKNGY